MDRGGVMSLAATIFAFCATIAPTEEMKLNCFDQMISCTTPYPITEPSKELIEKCKDKVRKMDMKKHWDDYEENK